MRKVFTTVMSAILAHETVLADNHVGMEMEK